MTQLIYLSSPHSIQKHEYKGSTFTVFEKRAVYKGENGKEFTQWLSFYRINNKTIEAPCRQDAYNMARAFLDCVL